MKIFKATCRVYLNQIIATIAAMFFLISLYPVAESTPEVFSLITAALYILIMYNTAWKVGLRDARKIPGYFPDRAVPIKISLYTAIIPLILLILRIIFPDIWRLDFPFMRGEVDFFLKDMKISGTTDFIYRMWYFCFAGFIPSGNLIAYFLQILVLPVVIFIGYYVGLKRFSVIEYLYTKLVFSGKKNDKTKNKK